ncbi:MAG: hypothetical protein IPN58_21210 [Anaerolineales bacterium]|nr:hypothetical protein [Anaerolineales bacterium]
MQTKILLSWLFVISPVLLTLLAIISSRQMRVDIKWLPFMEFVTPALILSWALTIYFFHKAQPA